MGGLSVQHVHARRRGGGAEYCCDQICTGGTCTYNYNMAGCDTSGTPSNPSPNGICVVCIVTGSGATVNGGSIDETICGSSGPDVVDGRGGNDIIEGRQGDDQLDGGSGADNMLGGPGTDVLAGSSGNDILVDYEGDGSFIEGGPGEDTIVGSDNDDELYGGDDNDFIVNGNGGDWVEGGSGNDTLTTILFPVVYASQDIGSTYCGGAGTDYIAASGGAHHCMDGGSGTDDCSFAFNLSSTQTAYDVGTALGCETTSGVDTRTPKCGCP